eukprot:c12935_g1_i1.p1 GENE.c12935_g1_i1~~c12935_g1_i1.p1  ORF type:complete len:539 (-),score=89.13 c12935_g1_i1:1291-2853(-)
MAGVFNQQVQARSSKLLKAKKRVKGLDPFVKISLLNEAGDVIESKRTETVKDGGNDVEFLTENRIEFDIPGHIPQPLTARKLKTLVIEVWDEDLGLDDIIGRCIVKVDSYWSVTSRPEKVMGLNLKEILSEEERDVGSKPGGRGKIFASIYRDGPQSDKLVVECWNCAGLIHQDEEMSITTTLLLCSVAFLVVYFVIGIAVFATNDGMNPSSKIGDYHGSRILNAAYFTVVIGTTIGYGDVLPLSDGMKIFTAFYALVGITFIGAALGIVASYISELKDQLALKVVRAEKGSADDAPPSFWKPLVSPIVTILILVLIGTIWFHYFENFTWAEAFYTTMISLLTVGYGDFSFSSGTPTKSYGRVFGIFYLLLGTLCFARAIGTIIYAFILSKLESLADWRLGMMLTPDLLDKMDEDHSGQVTEKEFIQFMIQHVTKVTPADIQLVRKRFREVDVDGSKTVTKSDLLPAIEELPVPKRQSTITEVSALRLPKSPLIDRDIELRRMSSNVAGPSAGGERTGLV